MAEVKAVAHAFLLVSCFIGLLRSIIYCFDTFVRNEYDDIDISHVAQPEDISNFLIETALKLTVKKPKLLPQPTSPVQNKYVQLIELCDEIFMEKFTCKPEDVLNPEKHKIPKYYLKNSVRNNSNNETQNAIVNYIIAALLITSLGAALLELYRAKTATTGRNEKKGAKAPLSRKCSLADLTVLKHHRRELIRRESILEQHPAEDDAQSHQQLPDTMPSPFRRRSSFQASSNEAVGGFPSRRNSQKLSMTVNDFPNRRMSIVNDGVRKLSIVTDEALWRRSSVTGEDSSPERRTHHTRLVHRH